MDEHERKYHDVANIFPLIEGEEYEKLKEDIQQNGLIDPIWLHPDGSIIDGRNRHRACIDTDTKPRFRTWDGKGSLVQFSASMNLYRRQLSSTQRTVIAVEIEPMLAEEARERQAHGLTAPGKTLVQKVAQASNGKAREQAAKIAGTNKTYVSNGKRIKKKAPDLFEKMKNGDKTITQANRELKERKREERRQENKAKINTVTSIKGVDVKFATIVIDPPWDWGDEGDNDQLGRARPVYKTMSVDEIESIPIAKLSDVDCHIYLWITNRSLPKGFDLLTAWGFRYITCITWVKPHFGMGNYFRGQTEQVLFGVKGSQPLMRKNAATVFYAKRGDGHSSKPSEFYDLVESCSPGPYIDIFSRNKRIGWTAWGENGYITD